MNRNQIIANVAVAGIGIAFIALIMWLVPEKSLDFLIMSSVSIGITTIILWRSKIDQAKDERTMHLMCLGARNAFFFQLFAVPMLSTFIILGIIIMDAIVALWSLYIVSLGIAWASFLFYYSR
ncbi:hypothetical protein E4H12_01460 [Candidatus Thorarchaeota archaeon]|nr:MAG: hypothetical protein E4H12_01460 [Candidatus Thorarchaeota archaeon]